MIHVSELYGEHSDIAVTHPTLTKLEGQSYSPEIIERYMVYDDTSTTNYGYLVCHVKRWPDPLGQIDIAATEKVDEYICGCDGFFYHYAKDSIIPSGECKHIETVRQYNRKDAAIEANQKTL